jgi:hypothetical protein
MPDFPINRKKAIGDIQDTFTQTDPLTELVQKKVRESQMIPPAMPEQMPTAPAAPLSEERMNAIAGRAAAMRELKQNEVSRQQQLLSDLEDKMQFVEGDEKKELEKRFEQVQSLIRGR